MDAEERAEKKSGYYFSSSLPSLLTDSEEDGQALLCQGLRSLFSNEVPLRRAYIAITTGKSPAGFERDREAACIHIRTPVTGKCRQDASIDSNVSECDRPRCQIKFAENSVAYLSALPDIQRAHPPAATR